MLEAAAHTISKLGRRPETTHHLNGGSFQQDAIVTSNNVQYAAVYLDHRPGVRRVHLLRRKVHQTIWESFQFTDYDQVLDDGHNIIALGISPNDGRIHLAWDLHSSTFNYRISKRDLTSRPDEVVWAKSSFGPIAHELPGLPDSATFLAKTTYPRFLSVPSHLGQALLFEIRTGIAGLGSNWLFVYNASHGSPTWTKLGIYLKGVENNPYINGLDIDASGTLHVTFCYRAYLESTSTHTGPAQHAGPNGPERNYDLYYVYSPIGDEGYPGVRWYNNQGEMVGRAPEGVDPSAKGIRIFDIPMNSGVLNQEAQCLGPDGVHVLNRETIGGTSTWMHYTIPFNGSPSPSRTPLSVKPLSPTSPRGKLVHRRGRLLALLPLERDVTIWDLERDEEVTRISNAGGVYCQEPLYDRYRDDVLSIFACIDNELVVVDLNV